MKQFAPVAPIWLLQKMGPAALSYHLPLAHDVLKFVSEYYDYFKSVRSHSDATIILDNSVIELGSSVSIDILLEAAKICHATHMVLPDVLLDADETIDISVRAAEQLRKRSDCPLLVCVPQGKTAADWIRCAEIMNELIDFDMWGVPRNFEGRLGTRYQAVRLLELINPAMPIHLLGFSDSVYMDVIACQHKLVRGIDSAVPIRMGQMQDMIFLHSEPPPRGDWWNSVSKTTPIQQMTFLNMERIRRWINVGEA